uniref:helix-turn-helix domain-containing protein n=1 Tax=Carnobacterium maltaromaticum TaxID=2751 RepID=UPI001C3E9C79|nr:helix-turn-helix transcriptional regulator [Carnobacterium maltaromaticum]
MSELDKQLGNLLKKFRLNAKLSQKELSENIISRSTYTRVEYGETKISSTDLIQILDRLNLNYVEFFYLIEQDKTEKRLTLEESQQLGSNPNTTTQDLQNFYIKNMKKYKETNDMFYYFSAIFAKVKFYCRTLQKKNLQLSTTTSITKKYSHFLTSHFLEM